MNTYDPLRPDQEINDSRSLVDRFVLGIMVAALVLCFVIAFTATSGCLSYAKNTYIEITATPPTPTPEPTPTPTPEPTPTPIPTEDPRQYMLRTNGYDMGKWLHYWRENATGYLDVSTHITVYDYLMMDSYHYHDSLWGTDKFWLQKPDPGMKYIFVFINMWSDTDARQWVWPVHAYQIYIDGEAYNPDEIRRPEEWIRELEEVWDFAHVDNVVPYRYKIVQEMGTGILSVESIDWLIGGRSNAIDGYILFQIPKDTKPEQIRVYGNFANLGGFAWWQLK